ncbi:MAG: hypothetical protein HQ474_09575 [Flammeovirgaceae bacterium]|jgi:hypothetical protein|nr:hypothetical protein [Flammeovirgaceae bacterium]|tara:strand:- start:50073 stop:50450 length:378 start_codon:yes stop_codon:yes gene_type:complete
MKFIFKIVLIALFSYLLPFYLPWWSISISAGIICFLIPQRSFDSFNSAIIGSGLTWLTMTYQIDQNTNSFLSTKIASLMSLSDPIILIYLTGIIGALIAGFGALTGNTLRVLITKNKKSNSVYIS